MDNYDRHRVGNRYNNNSSEEAHHYDTRDRRGFFPSSRFSDGGAGGGGGPPFDNQHQDNYRSGGGGGVGGGRDDSPHSYRSGGGGREHHRTFDSPPRYPQSHSGREGGGELRPISNELEGFRPMPGVVGGFRPMGGVGGGFRPMIGGFGDAVGPRSMTGGRGGDSAEFGPASGGGDNSGRIGPMGGGGDHSGRSGPMGGGNSDNNGRFGPMAGGPPMAAPAAAAGGNGGEFRPIAGGGDGGGFGVENYHMPHPPPLAGQKRGYPFSGRDGLPDKFDGASFAKLFVGSVPRSATEEDIRPLFDKHGRVLEVALIKDRRTGQQQGCCFIKYASSEEADRAIRALHNQYTLPGGVGPIQVRYADGERERLGATEYKLFVGALNKQATEKEVEEIFLPYGRVDDVYLMRDEMKQSRGCGFVKYSQQDTAQAAINALNGKYIMRGCDQPLTVRFADPKRPRPGESRGGPSLGGPGFGPRFPATGIRPALDHGEQLPGFTPNSWPPVSPQSLGPPPNVGIPAYNNQLPARSVDTPSSFTPGHVGGHPGNSDGSFGSNPSPLQRPYQTPDVVPSSLQLQPRNAALFSKIQSSRAPHMQSQMQMPYAGGQNLYNQGPPPQQLPGPNGQFPVPQERQGTRPAQGQAPAMANHQQPPLQQLQTLHQSPSRLAQMLSQQKQSLQATFQLSQQAFSQLQQQVQQLQPSNQTLSANQGPQSTKQQPPWSGIVSQPVPTTAGVHSAGDSAPTSASPNISAVTLPTPAVNCNWSEHTSPDGYKYYYNSLTGESKWEKPEDLKVYEQQQKQQKPATQHHQVEPRPQGPPTQHSQVQVQLQGQYQAQHQNQIRPLQQASQSFSVPGFSAKQNNMVGYAQIPRGSAPANDPARYQQAPQDWMWKNKP